MMLSPIEERQASPKIRQWSRLWRKGSKYGNPKAVSGN